MRHDPIVAAFDRLARRGPTVALVASPRGSATRGDVDAWARAIAARLDEEGATPGEPVLLSATNGAGFLAALVACRRAGLVPILCDCTSPPAERARIGRALGARLEIACAAVLPARADDFAIARGAAAGTPLEPVGAGYVRMTSGSTGEPSGVAVAAEALSSDDDQLAAAMGLASNDRFLATIPWSHSYGLSSLVLPALKRGSLLIVPGGDAPWSPLEAGRQFGATVFPTVPAYLSGIAALSALPPWPPTLRTVISAGAPLAPDTAARFRRAAGVAAHVFYGASECGGITYDRTGGAAEEGTVGTPVDGVRIALEDGEEPGEGRVAVRSAAVGLTHVPNPDDRLGDGVFRSTDIAAWAPGGSLRLLGRADAVINVSGKKVHPLEVEAVLRGMPGVRDAAVVGAPKTETGRETVRAYVACDPGRVTYASLAAWCRKNLARHKIPRSVVFVEAIPRTGRGKLDRAALVALGPARTSR